MEPEVGPLFPELGGDDEASGLDEDSVAAVAAAGHELGDGLGSGAPDESDDDPNDEADGESEGDDSTDFDHAAAVSDAYFPPPFSICSRVSTDDDGTSTWAIVGPFPLARHINPLDLTRVVRVRGPATLSSREVYVRACGILANVGVYPSRVAAHHSVRLVARNINIIEPVGIEEPSWVGLDPDALSKTDISVLLTRASRANLRSSVKVLENSSASRHPWRLYAFRQRDRRVARRAVVFYRRRVSELIENDSGVVRALAAGPCARLRRALELVGRPKDGSVSTRKRVSHGCTMPRLLPSRKAYATLKRSGVDSGVVPHRLWTLDAAGEVEAWAYVAGSAFSGVRRYTLSDGRTKRLASGGIKRSATGFAFNSRSGTDPTSLADQDTTLADDLRASTTSYLEALEDRERSKVVAVEFDGPALVQRAINDGLDPAYGGDPLAASNVITVAADGGPVCRRTLTVVTVTLSSEFLVGKQSPLLPLLYVLGGEGLLHTGIGRRLRRIIGNILESDYLVPRRAADGQPSVAATEPSTQMVTVQPKTPLRLCADFAMQCHFLAITGGSGVWRCPSGYPCKAQDMGTPSAPSRALSRPRTVSVLDKQWLLSIWSFGRWCALRTKAWICADGAVGVACRSCKNFMTNVSPGAVHLSCRTGGCALSGSLQGEVLAPLPKSTIGTAFRAARHVFGGVRGTPIIPDVPIAVQHPLLHCTSSIVKAIVYFMLAWFTRSEEDTARQGIHGLEGKTNLGEMYGREFRDMAAKLLACPDVLGVPIDRAIMLLFSLSQLLSAAWRKSVGRGTGAEREAAAAVVELTATLLAPLFSVFKRLDPVTKDRGVLNLYIHAAAAHAREHTGSNTPPVPLVSDDDIEGVIRAANVYTRSRTSNVSRVEAVTDMHALLQFVTPPARSRFCAEAGVYTATIRLCACAAELGQTLSADFKVAEAVARRDEALSCAHSVGGNGSTITTFALPESIKETEETVVDKVHKAEDDEVVTLGMERRIALSLVRRQATIDICFCGNLGGEHSRMANVLLTTPPEQATPKPSTTEPTPPEPAPPESPRPSSNSTGSSEMNASPVSPAALTGVQPSLARAPVPIYMEQLDEKMLEITPYLPPVALRRCLFGDKEEVNSDDNIGKLEPVVREELTMVEMLVRRTHTAQFVTWCGENAADVVAIRVAAEQMQVKLMSFLVKCTDSVMHVV